jgi:hypothetical protein
LITKKQQIEYRRSIVEKFLIRGKSTRAIAGLLESEYKISVCQATVAADKKHLDEEIMKLKDQYISNLPVVAERLRRRIDELVDMTYSVADKASNEELRLKAINLLKDLTICYAELTDDLINVNQVSSMLTRTEKKVEDLSKKQEVTVF